MNRSLDSILIKPAGPDCNLACRYCFYLDKAEVFSSQKVHRMSEATLELMVQQMMAQKLSQVSFNWQGGEPTLMGLSFFQKAVELQQKYGKGQQVSNSLQTNGLLINEEWCAFLRSFNFLVGLSLDGPEHVHDYYRQSLSGQGSHSRVLESYRMMRERGVEVNALSVLTDYSVNHINEIYQSHKELGLNFMQFIPCLETKDGEIQDYSLSPEAYGEALCKLFDLWINDFEEGMPTTSIRFFDSIFYHYVGLSPPDCTMREHCGVYLVVEHNGDVFPCDFYVEESLNLGNIKENNLVELFNSQEQFCFGQKKAELPETCLTCQWLKYCRGGCPKERLAGNLNYFCKGLKEFYQHADRRFQLLATRWKHQQKMDEQQQKKEDKPGRNSPCSCGSGKKFKKCCGK